MRGASTHLLVYEAKEGDADLHAQVVQAEDGRLQQQEAGDEEEAEPQGEVVALAPLGCVEGVKGGDDSPRQLRLHRLGGLLRTERHRQKTP